MVRPYVRGRRCFRWLLVQLGIWLTLSCMAVTAAPPTQMDAAAQCAEGVERFLAGELRAALPWLEAGFGGRSRASFAQPDDLGYCALMLGFVRHRIGHDPDVLEPYEVALGVFSRSGNRLLEGDTLHHMGEMYRAGGQYEKALLRYKQALAIRREVGNRVGEATTLDYMGRLSEGQGRYGEALAHYEQALAIRREVGDRAGEGLTLGNMGEVYQDQGRYGEALTYYEQALSIQREIGHRRGEGITLNAMGEVYRAYGRYREALMHFEQALTIQREVGNHHDEAVALNGIGMAYEAQGRYREALAHFEQALAIVRRVGNRVGEGSVLSNMGGVYEAEGRYEEALTYYDQALHIAREIGNRAGEGSVLSNMGIVYRAQGRYEEALAHYEQALAIRRKVGNRAGEGTTLTNMGVVYMDQGRYREALAHFEQALTITRQAGNRAYQGTILNNMGQVYKAQGWYGEALTYYDHALMIAREVGNRGEEGAILHNIGLVYEAQRRSGEALRHYKQALHIARQVGNRAGEGGTLSAIGGVYQDQRLYGEALTRYEQALHIARQVGNRAEEGAILNNIGQLYQAQGHYKDALERYDQALTIRREVGGRAGEAITLASMGGVYEAQGRYEEALTYYDQALAIQREVGGRVGEGSILANMGVVYQAKKQYTEAQPRLEAAAALIESLRQVVGSSLARTGFIDQFGDVYRLLTLNSLRLGLFEKAFVVSERGRARTFLDEMTSGTVTLGDNIAGKLLQQEQVLFAERRAIDDELARLRAHPAINSQRLVNLEAQRVKVQHDYDATLGRLRTVNEELAMLASGEPLGVKEVQSLLPPHTTLLAYFFLDEATIAAFLLTRTRVEVVEMAVESAALTDHIRSFSLFADLGTAHPPALVDLHTALITPLLEHLTTPHLIIVPHAVLHYVPFAALTDGTTYLGDRFLLTTLPSASTLPFVLQKRKDAATLPPPLVFGNPTTAMANLPSLAFAERETARIGQLYGVRPLMRDHATKQTLLEQASTAGIVHLAAHGRFDAAEPLESFIALAPDPDKQEDGQLTVREVYNTLRLARADLVVLSACQTNVGEVSNGDEVVGLTRAFIFAGTPSVIATLWSVDDRATGLLMEQFYTYLRAGTSKAEALQKAQQAVRKVYPHPYYWGAFVLTGDGGDLTAPPGSRELHRSAQP